MALFCCADRSDECPLLGLGKPDISEAFQYPYLSRYNAPPKFGASMKRREFITLIGGAAATWPLTARAQQPERIRRVGVLTPYTKQYFVDRNDVAALTNEFQRLGWEEGRNFHLEYRGVAPNCLLYTSPSPRD